MIAYFNRFTIEMTLQEARMISGQGEQKDNVKLLLKQRRLRNQLEKIGQDAIRAELKEYGAWTEEELSDFEDNCERITWIAGSNIREEQQQKENDRRWK